MVWQYRTIVFEFAKDGLLGDRYIDDEDMEKTLNSQGIEGWELVSAVMVQEGVLAVMKRPGLKGEQPRARSKVDTEKKETLEHEQNTPITAEQIQQEEREHIRFLEQKRQEAMKDLESNEVGEIKIS